MGTRFQRPLPIVERLWLAADAVAPPYANQVVVEGQGVIDQGRLEDAVAKASEANPGSRLILRGALRGCYWLDSGLTPPVRCLKDVTWDGRGSENAPFLMAGLPYRGPTCEVLYLESGPVTRLVFRSNHGAMDGMGTVYWAEDIFRVLRDEEPLGSLEDPPSMVTFLRQFTDRTRIMPPVNSIAPTGRARGFQAGTRWKRLTFTGSFSKVLGKVGWALAHSARQYGSGPVMLAIPVDLRQRQPGLRTTNNMSMALYVEVTPEDSPEDIAREVKRQLDEKYDCMLFEGGTVVDMIPIALLQIGLKLITLSWHYKGTYSSSTLLSNLGRFNRDNFRGAGFQADTVFLIPPRVDGIPSFVVLTGCADRLEVTVSLPSVLATDNRLERLLDDISQVLR
ncbi:MAG: hypothetical protein ABFD81_02950 [Syntrophaceae bacterium]